MRPVVVAATAAAAAVTLAAAMTVAVAVAVAAAAAAAAAIAAAAIAVAAPECLAWSRLWSALLRQPPPCLPMSLAAKAQLQPEAHSMGSAWLAAAAMAAAAAAAEKEVEVRGLPDSKSPPVARVVRRWWAALA